MNILLLEPDRLLATSYTRSLERVGHQVASTRTAQAAISLADERTPDLVIIEIAGARHNGIEFLYEFRSYFEWLDIPVIVLTDLPVAGLRQNPTLMRELGVREVLPKATTSLQTLNARVTASLGQSVA